MAANGGIAFALLPAGKMSRDEMEQNIHSPGAINLPAD
jgi:hypothetical protein